LTGRLVPAAAEADKEIPFGPWLKSLRVRLGLSQQALSQALGGIPTRTAIGYWESGYTAKPQPTNLANLCRFFLDEGALRSYNDVLEFCLSAEYLPRFRLSEGGHIEVVDVAAAQDRFQSVGGRLSDGLAEARGSLRRILAGSLGEGLQTISQHLRAIRPPASARLIRLESRLGRLLKSEPRDLEGLEAIRKELDAITASECEPGERFAAERLTGQLLMGLHDYDGALCSFRSAYYLGRAFQYRQAPWALEGLAELCELVAKAYLSIGTRRDWDMAEYFLREALTLREQVSEEFGRLTEEGVTATLQSMLELARAETHRRDLVWGEQSYLRLLKNPALKARPFLHASVEKELADNYRLDHQWEAARERFQSALELYSKATRDEQARNDPVLMMEAELNIGYCLRRLDREGEAVERFRATLSRAQRLRDRRRIAHACNNLACSPEIQKDPVAACTYLFAAMSIFEQMGAEADLEYHRPLWQELSERLSLEEEHSLPERCRQMRLL